MINCLFHCHSSVPECCHIIHFKVNT